MILKIITLLLLLSWSIYWKIEERKADREKPKQHIKSLQKTLGFVFIYIIFIVIFAQLLGFSIATYTSNITTVSIGFILVLVGIVISVSARIVLATNWANGQEYQIKKNHELITKGIYTFIRHPIYVGMLLFFIGAELVAGSWLWVSALTLFIPVYIQGKREEKILLKHFGNQYKEYMKKSKMLIPFVL